MGAVSGMAAAATAAAARTSESDPCGVPLALLREDVRELDSTASCVFDHDAACQVRKARALGLGQDLDERGDPPFERGLHALSEPSARGRDADFDGAAVRRRYLATNEPAPLRSVDETRYARLVELQVTRELVDAGGAIAQHSEQARLDQREVVLRCDPTEGALNQERELRQCIHHAELPVARAPGLLCVFALHAGKSTCASSYHQLC
jgi:hypothetical protein